jgi:large subunit ribosomal protein L9
MEVILKENVEHLGYKDEVKTVKSGYARNYLIPRGLAITANKTNLKVLGEILSQRSVKEQKLVDEFQTIADALAEVVVKVGAKVSEKGKIFGSVTTIQIAEGIHYEGHVVDRKQIHISEDSIKELGTYTAKIKLHPKVEFDLQFEVVKE